MTLAANLMVSMASKFESKPLLPTLMETMAGRFGSRPLLPALLQKGVTTWTACVVVNIN